MDRLLRSRMVNRSDKKYFRFTLNCTICGYEWESEPIPVTVGPDKYDEELEKAYDQAYYAAEKRFLICNLCGETTCDHCQVPFGKMMICANCEKRILEG